MSSDAMRTSRVIGLALIVGVFFTAEEVFMDLAGRRPQLAGRDVVNGAVFWLVWAFLTPFAVAAVRRWPLDARSRTPWWFANAIVAVTLATVHNLIAHVVQHPRDASVYALLGSTRGTPFVWGLFTGVLFYAVIAMVDAAARFRRLYVAEQVSAARLAQELSETKLDRLRSQLRPHFLFNTLNAISVFVKEDADTAQQMILRLSTLLRRSLDEPSHEVPLENELVFLDDYLDIQRRRFGDRLAIDVAVEPEVLQANVPVFLLQPLLENAIEHGGGSSDGRCTITLRARRAGEMLDIMVTDDGRGFSGTGPRRERVGLGNTRERLHHLYGPRATVDVSLPPPRGAQVHIRIPLRAART